MGFKYILEITAELERTDNGYWSQTKLNEFLEKCEDTKNLRVFISEGNRSPRQIPARIRISKVIVDV